MKKSACWKVIAVYKRKNRCKLRKMHNKLIWLGIPVPVIGGDASCELLMSEGCDVALCDWVCCVDCCCAGCCAVDCCCCWGLLPPSALGLPALSAIIKSTDCKRASLSVIRNTSLTQSGITPLASRKIAAFSLNQCKIRLIINYIYNSALNLFVILSLDLYFYGNLCWKM